MYYVNQLTTRDLYDVVKPHFNVFEQIPFEKFEKCLTRSLGLVRFKLNDNKIDFYIDFGDLSLDVGGEDCKRFITSNARLKQDYEKMMITKFKDNQDFIGLMQLNLEERRRANKFSLELEIKEAEKVYKKEEERIESLEKFIVATVGKKSLVIRATEKRKSILNSLVEQNENSNEDEVGVD